MDVTRAGQIHDNGEFRMGCSIFLEGAVELGTISHYGMRPLDEAPRRSVASPSVEVGTQAEEVRRCRGERGRMRDPRAKLG